MVHLPGQGVRNRLSAEHGVTLIETLISAVILVIVVGAVLTTIDASGRTTAVNKNRSVAATLAEQDQERLRAMSPTLLVGATRAVWPAPGFPTYNINSKVEWIFDATGATESCKNDTGQANYLQISSTVTSKVVGTRVKAVTMRSLVAPLVDSFADDAGTLTVLVTDELGKPVKDMTVAITPAASVPRDTNEFGCAVFSHIPSGSYTATLNRVGWVSEKRNQLYVSPTAIVNTNQTTNASMTYAKAAAIEVHFKTKVGAAALQPSLAHAMTVSNAKSGDVTFLAPEPGPVETLTATSLFPYPDGYSTYTGRCALNDPTDSSYTNGDYFATYPGFTNVTPAVLTVIDARQPSVNLKVVGSGAVPPPLAGARVIFTASPDTSTCGAMASLRKYVRTTDVNGLLTDPGLPFGRYTYCVDKVLSGTMRREDFATPFSNASPAGVTLPTVALTTSDQAQTCATG